MPSSTHSHTSPALELEPLDLVHDELLALDGGSLSAITADISVAAQIVLGTAWRMPKYRADLVAMFGQEMTRPVDRLELVARAAMQAEARHRAFVAGDVLDSLVARVANRRERLRAEVRSLVARELLPRRAGDGLGRGRGFRSVSFDLLRLVATLRSDWAGIESQTGLSLGELDEAENAAGTLMTELGVRSKGPRAPSAEMRVRAFTLMVSTYDHTRRLITCLRWNDGDADLIAPSLFNGRTKRRRASAPRDAAAEEAAGHADRPIAHT